jgi:hypothetical protein
MKKDLKKISRKSIIDKYYSEIYDKYLNDDGLIRIANRTLERKIEHNSNKQDNYVLEIGGGGGTSQICLKFSAKKLYYFGS